MLLYKKDTTRCNDNLLRCPCIRWGKDRFRHWLMLLHCSLLGLTTEYHYYSG